MNNRHLSEKRANWMILLGVLFILSVIAAVYWLTSSGSPDGSDRQRYASRTGTALALTSDALLGPFPTATAPTATASEISSPTWTPTRTPTRTRTPTTTPVPVISFTARTNQPRATFTNTPRPPTSTLRPRTSTPRPRTSTPRPPTQPPPATTQPPYP